MRSTPAPRLAVAALASALLLAGCGTEDSSADAATDAASSGSMDGMEGMDMSMMNEPDATPAYDVDGAVTSGDFTVLDTAPPNSEGVSGEAWLAQDRSGTTVTIELSGLVPGTDYVSHLHAQSCAEDDGGPHFAFDPDGEEVPPNEVHLAFTADDEGSGTATVTNDRKVGDAAPAIVVHPADAMDNRLACADFS